MKIAFIIGTFFPQAGGAQVQAHNICNKLTEKNIDIDCYIFNKTNIKNNNYKIFLLSKFLTSLAYFFKFYLNLNINFILKYYLKKIIKKNKYEFWHFIFLNHKCLILIECLNQLNQKVFVTFQGADIQVNRNINYGFRINKKYDNYLRKIVNNVNHFFYISKTIKKDLLNLKISENKMSYAPNSVEIEKFEKYHILKNANKKLNLITVARYSPQKKGYDILLKVCKELISKQIDFEWKIIGKGTKKLLNETIIKSRPDSFKIIENIENIDETYFPNSELIKHYISSDLYINLSRIESFGITFVESLASLVPIITFDTKGVNEIVKDNVNGFLIKNEEDLVKKVEEIYKTRDLINDMKDNLIDTIREYDLNLVTEKYKSLNYKF